MKINYFPEDWKIGEAVYFLKGDKSPDLATSYRPISLLSVFGKVFEKIILKRLNYFLNDPNRLFNSQHGFQENKSTETAIKEVFSQIDLLKQEDVYISLVSIDFKNAFDSLPWDITLELLQTLLQQMNYDENTIEPYVNLIRSYLSRRGILPHWLANSIHWLRRGCPQGSCLGPFLWRVFVQSLINEMKRRGFKVVAFADDILLILYGRTRKILEEMGKEALQIINNWATENHIKISYEKCKAMNLKKPKFLKRAPIFKINNHAIKTEITLPYLGITLDPTLSFLPHLRNKKLEINIIIQNLLKFTSYRGGLSKNILKIWYLTILEKKATYAAAIWYDMLQKSHGLRILSSIQAQCLLLISGAYKKSPTLALCALTGIPPLHLVMKIISTAGKVLRLGTQVEAHYPDLYQNKSPSANICPFKPYLKWQEEQDRQTELNIFTDGSKIEENTGFAYCCYHNEKIVHTEQFKLSYENSVFQAELLVILKAVEWTQKTNYNEITIHTVSRA